jgi:cysteine-S-conjugate beta-lyase
MSTIDFNKIIDRQQYPTQKWNPNDLKNHFNSEDVLPLWIADMDFAAPSIVMEKLQARVQQGVYGYEYRPESFYQAVVHWYKTRHQWKIDPQYIEPSPSVLSAISILINQHTHEGDGIIVQPPVFFEFRQIIRKNNREVIKNPLKLVDGRYEIDFDDLEEKTVVPSNKLLILCNPHNPVGRVWTKEELQKINEVCQQNNVLVISDEIHSDIVYKPHRYTPYASLPEVSAEAAFTCISPAKTFNIPGIVDAMIIIPHEPHRQRYDQFADKFQINRNNVFALTAMETAYQYGEDWLTLLLGYLQENISVIRDYLSQHIPQVRLIDPQGTFLVWLDFRGLGMEAKELDQFLAQNARLAISPGYWFGREGAGFARMNIAVPRSVLLEALSRLAQACASI